MQRDGYIKIGRAVDVDERLRAFRTASAEPIHLLGYIPAKARYETELHERFAWCRLSRDDAGSEWFKPKIDLLLFMAGRGIFPKLTLSLIYRVFITNLI